jgi:hypothetical protein
MLLDTLTSFALDIKTAVDLGIGIYAKVFARKNFCVDWELGSRLKFFGTKTLGAIGNWELNMINKNNKLINHTYFPFLILNKPFPFSFAKSSDNIYFVCTQSTSYTRYYPDESGF